MASRPAVTYAPGSDVSTENEMTALANVYAFVLSCHAKKKAGAAQNTGHNAKGSDNDDRVNTEYTG